MKIRISLPFWMDRALRREIESVLREEETLFSFHEEAIRLELARRQGLLGETMNGLVPINGLGSSEVFVDEAEIQEDFLVALVSELKTSTARAAAALDRTILRLDESERWRPEFEAAARQRAQNEFADLRR